MKSNYKHRMKEDNRMVTFTMDRFKKEVEKEFTKRYDDVINDIIPQWLAVMIWTEMIEYHHRPEWCIKKLKNIMYTADMLNNGYGFGEHMNCMKVIETLKSKGIDVVGIYDEHEKSSVEFADKGGVKNA